MGRTVVSLGHANPVVGAAISRQAERLLHVSNFFANPVATEAAQKVNELLLASSGHAGQVFFTNSGAESNECAIKLARKHGGRGRHTIVSTLGSFHGRTLATLAATGQPTKHEPFQPMPEGFIHVPFGDLAALDAAVDASVAAVLVECVQGEGGVRDVGTAFLRDLRGLCDKHEILLGVDEVQCGMGRTGKLFAHEWAQITPDVMAIAKAIGGGFPLGAFLTTQALGAVMQIRGGGGE